tara:strand:- start:2896 stop:3141 length:246 start_codon:yes stop_codon:yes gene_type:complete
MATGTEVLTLLIPNGGWYISGDEFENIQFLECEPITKAKFEAGFAKADKFKADEAQAKETAKAALLTKLGITADEAALLLS